jgi:hypothetical protein
MSLESVKGVEIEEALRPIASLIGKSEKARQKLTPGTWQHTMLGENLKALHIASALMSGAAGDDGSFEPDDLREALRALNSMIGRCEKAQAKVSPGTSQHTLLRNRIRALCMAAELVGGALKAPGSL